MRKSGVSLALCCANSVHTQTAVIFCCVLYKTTLPYALGQINYVDCPHRQSTTSHTLALSVHPSTRHHEASVVDFPLVAVRRHTQETPQFRLDPTIAFEATRGFPRIDNHQVLSTTHRSHRPAAAVSSTPGARSTFTPFHPTGHSPLARFFQSDLFRAKASHPVC